MALEGDLQVFHLPDILQLVAQQQKTGILTVQGEQDILAVSFLRGEIVAADALNQNFEEGLGEVLASQGVVRPEDFARVSEGHKISGQRLADYLVDQNILSRQQLLAALRQQTYRLLLQVLRWQEGEFKFYSGDEVSFEEGIHPISIEELLMRSIGDLLGEGTLSGTLPHGFVAYERLPATRTIRLLGRDGDLPGVSPEEVWISADDEVVLARLDGRATAAEVAQASGLGEYKTLYSLFRLLRAGLVRPRSGAPPGGRPGSEPAAEISPAGGLQDPPRQRAGGVDKVELPVESASSSAGTRVGRLLGVASLAALVALLAVATGRTAHLLFPFPWLRSERVAFERQTRVSQALLIDRAARTYFLLESEYPPRLTDLVERRMLPARVLTGPFGKGLHYAVDASSYTLRPQSRERNDAAMAVTESISGDFAVDPEFFRGLREEDGIPLVLLD